jgi:uncharacterized protein YqjF (DUF2071 family)
MAKTFLTAEWRKLAMANYAVDPDILKKYLPAKTELDFWNDACYVSLVGFMFLDVKLMGIPIPYHRNFEEVNLRFYVKYKGDKTDWKRGVVFIKEIVPKPAITFVANTLYGEKYQTLPMNHVWESGNGKINIEYSWKLKEWNKFSVTVNNESKEILNGSEEEFITEHYWGYTKLSESKTSEYQVRHPRWRIYDVKDYHIQVRFGELYGKEFQFLENQKPDSIFLAEGSEVQVKHGLKI